MSFAWFRQAMFPLDANSASTVAYFGIPLAEIALLQRSALHGKWSIP
jgi:hypothetical protein